MHKPRLNAVLIPSVPDVPSYDETDKDHTVELKSYNITINKETRGVKQEAAHCAGGPQVQRAGERGGDIIRILDLLLPIKLKFTVEP